MPSKKQAGPVTPTAEPPLGTTLSLEEFCVMNKTEAVPIPKIGSQSKHMALEKSGDDIIHFV